MDKSHVEISLTHTKKQKKKTDIQTKNMLVQGQVKATYAESMTRRHKL